MSILNEYADLLRSDLPHTHIADQLGVSEATVRRARKAQERLSLDGLATPYSDPDRLAVPRVASPRRPSVSSWKTGSDVDLAGGTGELRTRPVPVSEPIDPEDMRVLAEFGLDSSAWEVVSYRESRWEQRPEEWLHAYRVSVKKRAVPAGQLDLDTVKELLASYPLPKSDSGDSGRILMVPLADLQVGKPEGGGTEAIIQRFAAGVAAVEDRIHREFGGRVAKLIVPLVGDLIEGITSQGGRLPNDLGITEQVRVVRRLLLHYFGRLAPLADSVLVMTVPGNHDESRRDRITPAGDSWAIDIVAQVQDAMQLDPERFGHVTFVYPEPDDITVAVDIGGMVIGATHGHTIGTPDRMAAWLAGQALGRQAAGEADLLVSGHFHTLRMQDLGGGRTWIQCPSIDGGSAHFRARRGTDSTPGFISLELTPGVGLGWTGLIHHAS